jgi:2-oxoglutarate dehydrogenase E2 component (dihydrolipoamide succinyltransferase)
MAMATNVDVPAMGESITEAVLLEWLKADGDRVEDGESICVLETDKADVELPAPGAGVLHRLKDEGETVRVGESIARLEAAAVESQPRETPCRPPAAAPAEARTPAGVEPGPPPLEEFSPAVRRLLADHQLDPTAIRGTGRGGRLTKEDVLSAIEAQEPERETVPPQQQPVSAPASPPVAPPEAEPTGAPISFDEGDIRRMPMSKIRRRIAENLVAAQRTAAMLTTFNEIDMTAVLALRARYGERFRHVHGVSLGLMPFFARVCAFALQAFPIVNARIDGDDIVYHAHVHLGIAVSTERGLVVPVLRHAEAMSLARLEAEIERLAAAAREGKLAIQDLSGGTFTITNGGVFGSLLSTPTLNPPQSAILGMHAIQRRPIAVDERVEIRPMMYVALSYDHRLIDGREAVLFLVRIKNLIEDPTRLLLEV